LNALLKTELEAICDEVKKIKHVTNCTVDYRGDDQIWIVVESFLANDDGSRVERSRGIVILTTARFPGKAWIRPSLLMSPFRRAIEDKHQGFSRYATDAEVQAYMQAR
jgi:hypothetical protein